MQLIPIGASNKLQRQSPINVQLPSLARKLTATQGLLLMSRMMFQGVRSRLRTAQASFQRHLSIQVDYYLLSFVYSPFLICPLILANFFSISTMLSQCTSAITPGEIQFIQNGLISIKEGIGLILPRLKPIIYSSLVLIAWLSNYSGGWTGLFLLVLSGIILYIYAFLLCDTCGSWYMNSSLIFFIQGLSGILSIISCYSSNNSSTFIFEYYNTILCYFLAFAIEQQIADHSSLKELACFLRYRQNSGSERVSLDPLCFVVLDQQKYRAYSLRQCQELSYSLCTLWLRRWLRVKEALKTDRFQLKVTKKCYSIYYRVCS